MKEAVSRGPEPFLLRYTPFCAYMSKYIFLVRITKCVIAKSDYMPVLLLKELNRTLSQVYKYGLYWHCKSSFLVMKKQKVKTTVFRMQILRTGPEIK